MDERMIMPYGVARVWREEEGMKTISKAKGIC
jgi:hypothetical protein